MRKIPLTTPSRKEVFTRPTKLYTVNSSLVKSIPLDAEGKESALFEGQATKFDYTPISIQKTQIGLFFWGWGHKGRGRCTGKDWGASKRGCMI